MRARDIITQKDSDSVIQIRSSATVAEAIQLMLANNIGGLPVVDAKGHLTGFLSERDIVRALRRSFEDVRRFSVETVMTRPAPTCNANALHSEVMRRMTEQRLRHIVVVEERKVVGILSVGDLVKNRLEELELEAGVLRDYVVAHRANHA